MLTQANSPQGAARSEPADSFRDSAQSVATFPPYIYLALLSNMAWLSCHIPIERTLQQIHQRVRMDHCLAWYDNHGADAPVAYDKVECQYQHIVHDFASI